MKKSISPRTLQNLILSISFLVILVIGFLSIEIRNETENPSFWDIDYNTNYEIISAYGTLIGGILSFLSILFVLYNVYEVRHQLQSDKRDKATQDYNINLNRLKLISLTMDSTYDAIIQQGRLFKKYYEDEKKKPAMPSEIGRVTIKNIERLSDLDMEKVFLTLQSLDSEKDSSLILRDFFKYNDFYRDSLKQIFVTITHHIDEKTESIDSVSEALENLQEVVERFLISDDRPTTISGNFRSSWDNTIKHFYIPFKKYVTSNYEVDLEVIVSNHLNKFINDCQAVVRDEGFVNGEINEIFKQIVYIRNRIEIMKKNSLELAELIESQFSSYYDLKSINLLEYDRVRKQLKNFIDKCNNID